MSTFEVVSGVGVGAARLGMGRQAAVGVLRALADGPTEVGVQQPRQAALAFESGGAVQAWFDDSDRLEAVEVWGDAQVPVVLDGVAVTGLPVEDALVVSPGFVPMRAGDDESWVDQDRDVALTVFDGLVVAVCVGVPGYYAFLDDLSS